ncbi:MAG: sulfur carrier protein ThiS adenylyltransferase [Candidatus Sumerlaeota bacterium]|nr:sulfur carrier protein ThiS adenylyltransferase [Candidatus Sumerlaeota bacterium]
MAAGTTLFALRDARKPGADVLILNGYPFAEDVPLSEGDEVVLIRRGEKPSEEELRAQMVSRHGPGVHAQVEKAFVGIAGCGGLGSAVAVALARTGVGHLLLVDFDVVEPSNLNRQQFFIDQLGELKVEALKANLARINPYIRVEALNRCLTLENIPETFAACDVVAECFDRADMKRDIAIAMRQSLPDTPLVTASGLAGFGPSNTIRTRRVFRNVWLVGDGETAARPGRGLLAPRVGIAASHQANAVLRLLLGEAQKDGEEA